MKKPTPEQMRLAAEWLDVNEGNGEEQADCFAVRDWLRHQADMAEAHMEARLHGVSMKALRDAAKMYGKNIPD